MKLWIPGPTEVRSALLEECARPMIGHRSEAMARLHERIDPHLRLAFGLAQSSAAKVAVHTCSATGLKHNVPGPASRRGKAERLIQTSLRGWAHRQAFDSSTGRTQAMRPGSTATTATVPTQPLAGSHPSPG